MALFVQVLVTGLAAGAVYGLAAIGHTLVYRLTGVLHLALGELAGLSVFLTLVLSAGTSAAAGAEVPAWRFAAALLAALAVAVAAGAALYALAVRPFLRRGSVLGWVGALVAVAFAVRGVLAAAFPRQSLAFPDPLPFDRLGDGGVLAVGGGVTVPVRAFFVIALGAALAWVAARFVERSRTGRALRAIATNRDAAHAAGLPVDRLVAATFAGIGLLTAAMAIAAAPGAPLTPDTGTLLGLKGLVAAVVARFASPWRAFGAALGLGVLESAVANASIGGLRLGPAWRDLVPLAVAAVLIALRRGPEAEAE